jgi:hypothetical protein
MAAEMVAILVEVRAASMAWVLRTLVHCVQAIMPAYATFRSLTYFCSFSPVFGGFAAKIYRTLDSYHPDA